MRQRRCEEPLIDLLIEVRGRGDDYVNVEILTNSALNPSSVLEPMDPS